MPMKVIVCFDDVRVTVPCGDGSIPVAELISKAVHRYKRATGKSSHQYVSVTNLKSITAGGILDPDDQLLDVVDDREQLIAEFEEHSRPSLHHNGGDGASASSTGTVSPDFFQGSTEDNLSAPPLPALPPPRHNSTSNNTNTDVIITPRDLTIGSNLIVRRGSEPSLNLIGEEGKNTERKPTQPGHLSVKRVSIPRRESVRDSDEPRSESSDEDKILSHPMTGSLDRKRLGQNRFSRDATRTSLSNTPEMYRWLEAQERQELRTSHNNGQERTGPVEGHDGKEEDSPTVEESSSVIILQNDGGPLGIHAIPADVNGENVGLLVQSVEPDRPVHRDGRIHPNDIIVEINGTSLKNVPFLRAQGIFRSALDNKEISLKLHKAEASTVSQPMPQSPKQRAAPPPPPKPRSNVPPPPAPRSHAPKKPSPLTMPPDTIGKEQAVSHIVPPPRESLKSVNKDESDSRLDHKQISDNVTSLNSNNVNLNQTLDNPSIKKRVPSFSNNVIKPGPPIRPPKKPAPAVPARSPSRGVSPGPPSDLPVNTAYNTRKIGRKLVIELKKGPLGLGFSVTSRDNQTDGNTPIYIRTILPKGAAVIDGQLKPGDRLLEVNNIEMTGKTQKDAVDFLRELPQGSLVQLLVSRQEEVEEKFKVPRKMETWIERHPKLFNFLQNLSDPTDPPALSIAQPQEAEVPDGQREIRVEPASVSISQPRSSDKTSPPGQETEKITFHVQLNHTSGRAGLGVSVKGKTEPTDEGLRDLGIFVNSVLQGGAASKDGRLEVNDQLLEVNGINLECSSNTEAMESLRMAMMDDSLQPGQAMAVTVARRTGLLFSSPSEGSSLDSSQVPCSISQQTHVHQRSISSSSDHNTSVIHQRSSSASELSKGPQAQRFGLEMDLPSPIPPVRTKRMTALKERYSESGNGLRNDSYHKATNESLDSGPAGIRNESYMKATHDESASGPAGIRNESYMKATHDESAIGRTSPIKNILPNKYSKPAEGKENNLKNDNEANSLHQKTERPHSTIGFLHEGPRGSLSDDEAFRRESLASNGSDLSPCGDLVLPFNREGFGRQSMSEKRKGHLDPRNTEIYKLVKANKENKGAASGSPAAQLSPFAVKKVVNREVSPTTNKLMHAPTDSTYKGRGDQPDSGHSSLKRSSSVEDLSHTGSSGGGAEIVASSPSTVSPQQSGAQNRDSSPMNRSNRFGRARACNESFRAAVDRSYEVLDPTMDTLEEESAESGAFTLDPSTSARSSISSENPSSEDTNSLTRRKAKEKKSGLLKGFLRFGKGRKSNEEAMRRSRSEERTGDRLMDGGSDSSTLHSPRDGWAVKPSGDAHGFVPVSVNEATHQSGRHSSAQEEERYEEEYARLKNYQDKRLRSQSVDPTIGRHKLMDQHSPRSPAPVEQPPPLHSTADYRTHPHPTADPRTADPRTTDPRTFHPAAMDHGTFFHDQDFRDKSQYTRPGGPGGAKNVMSRAEYIQQLRSLYQQRHRQRQGVYPLDAEEELYERQIQDMEQRFVPRSSESTYDERIRRDQNFINHVGRGASEHLRDQHNYSSNSNIPSSSSYSEQQNYYQQPVYSQVQHGHPMQHAHSQAQGHYSHQQQQQFKQHHPHHYPAREDYRLPATSRGRDDFRLASSSSSHEQFETNHSALQSRSQGAPPLPPMYHRGHKPAFQTSGQHDSYTPYHRGERQRLDSAKV